MRKKNKTGLRISDMIHTHISIYIKIQSKAFVWSYDWPSYIMNLLYLLKKKKKKIVCIDSIVYQGLMAFSVPIFNNDSNTKKITTEDKK